MCPFPRSGTRGCDYDAFQDKADRIFLFHCNAAAGFQNKLVYHNLTDSNFEPSFLRNPLVIDSVLVNCVSEGAVPDEYDYYDPAEDVAFCKNVKGLESKEHMDISGTILIEDGDPHRDVIVFSRESTGNPAVTAQNLLVLNGSNLPFIIMRDCTISVDLHCQSRNDPGRILEVANGDLGLCDLWVDSDKYLFDRVEGENGFVTVCYSVMNDALLLRFGAKVFFECDSCRPLDVYGYIAARQEGSPSPTYLFHTEREACRHLHNGDGDGGLLVRDSMIVKGGNQLRLSVLLKNRLDTADAEDDAVLAEGSILFEPSGTFSSYSAGLCLSSAEGEQRCMRQNPFGFRIELLMGVLDFAKGCQLK